MVIRTQGVRECKMLRNAGQVYTNKTAVRPKRVYLVRKCSNVRRKRLRIRIIAVRVNKSLNDDHLTRNVSNEKHKMEMRLFL